MASSSENFPAMEPWTFRSPFPDSWISQSFIRDNEVLTKALQVSLSSNHPETVSPSAVLVSPLTLESPDPPRVHLRFKSDPDLTVLKRPKKKLRKSKQDTTTTFIMADPANFRQMVQQVTGERFSAAVANCQVAPPFKPEPQRLVQGYMPTTILDSKYHPHRQLDLEGREIIVSPLPTTTTLANYSSPTANFDPLSCFPTLESCSWKVL